MNIEQANRIPLSEILRKLNLAPTKTKGHDEWYLSPFREEKTASFHVNIAANIWYDFGEEKGGNVLSFVRHYLKYRNDPETVSDCLAWLDRTMGNQYSVPAIEKQAAKPQAPKKENALRIAATTAINKRGLIDYLARRGIPLDIAKLYLKEKYIYNAGTGSHFTALGLKNEEGGCELRNPTFKGCIGPKDITFIRGQIPKGDAIHIFEGFMDCLSIMARLDVIQLPNDAIILNSISCIEKAKPYITKYGYKLAYCWMDNDQAGVKANERLAEFFKLEDSLLVHQKMNGLYAPFKDVNDWHVHLTKPTL